MTKVTESTDDDVVIQAAAAEQGVETTKDLAKSSSVIVFERKEYNVTDTGCQVLLCLTFPLHFLPFFPGFMGAKRMVLEEEEAVLTVNCKPFCDVETRRPYGELGSVDQHYCLCCCTAVSSDLSKNLPLYVGWGCDHDAVSTIVGELKQRMKVRGDTGQIVRTEQALTEIKQLRTDVRQLQGDMRLLLEHFNVVPSTAAAEQVVMER